MTVLEVEATVTERGQTTVPAAIRQALHVRKGSVVVFRLSETGEVTLIAKAQEEPQDPVIGNFLSFLANDMLANPQHLQHVTTDWLDRMQSLVAGVAFDLDQPLSDEDE